MRNKIYGILTEIFRLHLAGEDISDNMRKICERENVLKWLYNVSKMHDLAHFVADFLFAQKVTLPQDIESKFKSQYKLSLYRYTRMQMELETLGGVLENNGFDHIFLKGSVLRKYYPSPELRTSSDIDVLIRKDEADKILEILIGQMGYVEQERFAHQIAVASPDGVLVELHLYLSRRDDKVYKLLDKIWDYATLKENKKYSYEMSNEMFVFYFVEHMAKHFLVGGCGLRSIIDLWIIRRNMPFDKTKTDALFEEYGLKKFYDSAVELSECWFLKTEMSDDLEVMEKFILSGGVYGSAQQRYSISENSGKKYFFKRLFLPMDTLKWYYPKVKKHPILAPFYQVKRWFKLLSKETREQASAEMKSMSGLSPEEKAAHLAMRKKLGL